VDEATFDRMKTQIMRDFPPSAGDDLAGMEIDFNAYLYGLEELEDANALRTDDPARLIVATATATAAASADKVATALEDVWLANLRYHYREGHVIRSGTGAVRMTAITQIAPDGFYVTAEVTVKLSAR
jgi:hypothetical protein